MRSTYSALLFSCTAGDDGREAIARLRIEHDEAERATLIVEPTGGPARRVALPADIAAALSSAMGLCERDMLARRGVRVL